MPDRKLKADSDTVDYILNMYSTYIDNLQITKLKELIISKNINIVYILK